MLTREEATIFQVSMCCGRVGDVFVMGSRASALYSRGMPNIEINNLLLMLSKGIERATLLLHTARTHLAFTVQHSIIGHDDSPRSPN